MNVVVKSVGIENFKRRLNMLRGKVLIEGHKPVYYEAIADRDEWGWGLLKVYYGGRFLKLNCIHIDNFEGRRRGYRDMLNFFDSLGEDKIQDVIVEHLYYSIKRDAQERRWR